MKKIYFILTAMAVMLTSAVKAQTVIAGWQVNSTNQTITGDIAATTKDPNLQTAELSRGSGLTAVATNYGYSSGVAGTTGNTEATAVTAGDYYLIKLKAANGTMIINKLNFRILRSANGPKKFKWSYSKNGGGFTDIGSEITIAESVTTTDPVRDIDLSLDANFLNIPNATTVTFRIVAYDVHTTGTRNFGLRNNLGNAVSLEGSLSTTLPVNLTSFTAKPQANAVQLNWQTASEQNNSHFEVLRSTDGTNFSVSGRKNGNGTTNQTNTYSFSDTKPVSGTSYYALKQYDLNGDSKQYDAIPVKFSLSTNSFSVVSTSSGIKLITNNEAEEQANVLVYNISGKQLVSKQIILSKGTSETEITNLDLVKGTLYLVKLKSSTQNQTTKFIK